MCFSATASFTAAAVLIPAGAYGMRRASAINPDWLPLAAYPILFGIQQAIEGFVWLGFNAGNRLMTGAAALGFSFFAHAFWLAWVPYSVTRFERGSPRRPALIALTVTGVVYGLSLFVPQLFMSGWLTVQIVQQSIQYEVKMIYDGVLGHGILRAFYAFIILVPLLLSRDIRLRLFSALIAASLIGTSMFYTLTFISVWCFFAAILSLYILGMIAHQSRKPRSVG